MPALRPGQTVEATGLIMPVRMSEAALALEDVVPRLVNAGASRRDTKAIIAIVDRFESSAFEQIYLESAPAAGGPIMPLEGEESTAALLDSWLVKGTLLGDDGQHSVFVAFMEVMRRPLQGSWAVQSISVMGTKQSVRSLLEELEHDALCA